MSRIRRRAWLWGPALAWAAVVLVASLVELPPGAQPATGPLGLVGADKWQHGLGYAALGGLVLRALDRRTVRAAALALVLAAGFGAGVEVCQAFVPARTASAVDATANAVGACLGVGATWLLRESLPSR